MRCDLHVHTLHSGMCTIPVARNFCRECYSDPEAVYQRLKAMGMHLVTITDHDSIGAGETLQRHPDFFLSEEVTCTLPTGTEIHVGVYDINERHHFELQSRRHDFESLLAYLREQNLFYTLNHIFSGLTGRRLERDFEYFERDFPGLETLNGAMLRVANEGAQKLARLLRKTQVGGSDAHSMWSVGAAWTNVAGATTKQDFMNGLRAGRTSVHGESGSMWKLTRDVFSICHQMMQEETWTTAFLPLMLAGVPSAIAVNYWLEYSFARKWMNRAAPSSVSTSVSEAVAGEVA